VSDPRAWFNELAPNVKGALVLVVAAFGFSVMVALIKLVGTRLPVTQILLVRQWMMVSMLIPAFVKDFPGLLVTNRLDLQVLRVTLALVAMGCGFTAVVNLPLADATALGFVKSFFVTIFAVLVLKETVGVHRWSAVALGFVGVLFMAQPGTDSYSLYGILALIGSAAAGCVMVIIRLLNRTESTNTISFARLCAIVVRYRIRCLVVQSMADKRNSGRSYDHYFGIAVHRSQRSKTKANAGQCC